MQIIQRRTVDTRNNVEAKLCTSTDNQLNTLLCKKSHHKQT